MASMHFFFENSIHTKMNLNLNGQWPIPCSRLVVGLGTGRRHSGYSVLTRLRPPDDTGPFSCSNSGLAAGPAGLQAAAARRPCLPPHASTAGGPHAACPRRALALAAPPVRLTIRIASENA